MKYSKQQQKYINSVDGKAHQSAIGIIGEVEQVKNRILSEVIPKIESLLGGVIIGSVVNFETIEKAISQLKNT